MPLISWNNGLILNINKAWQGHKTLISVMVDLHLAMGSVKGKNVMEKIPNGLIDSTKNLVACEKKPIRTHACLASPPHMAQHYAVTKQVVELATQLQIGKAISTMQIMKLLKHWNMRHFQGIISYTRNFCMQRRKCTVLIIPRAFSGV